MALTTAQLQAIKADIVGDSTLNANPNTPDGNSAIAAAYNLLASPNFFVYRTDIPLSDIYDQITWANLTPIDAPDGTQTWANRSLACQGKQFNLQLMLSGGQLTANASKANVRAGLQDALTNVPSATGTGTQSAGWVNVRDNALARKSTRGEKLLATLTQNGSTAALAATLTFEGALTYHDIEAARAS